MSSKSAWVMKAERWWKIHLNNIFSSQMDPAGLWKAHFMRWLQEKKSKWSRLICMFLHMMRDAALRSRWSRGSTYEDDAVKDEHHGLEETKTPHLCRSFVSPVVKMGKKHFSLTTNSSRWDGFTRTLWIANQPMCLWRRFLGSRGGELPPLPLSW